MRCWPIKRGEDAEEAASAASKSGRPLFRIHLASNVIFMVASALYLWLSVQDFLYQRHAEKDPKHLLEAYDNGTTKEKKVMAWYYDDDWVFGDDTVFTTKRGHDVSEYMITYFCAASLFVIEGIVNLFDPSRSWISGAFFIIAGGFDVAASLFVDSNPLLSADLDLVSSHFYFLEAVELFWHRERELARAIRIWTYSAYFLFGLGALLDVMLGYISRFASNSAEYSDAFVSVGVFGSTCWLASALILVMLTIVCREKYYDGDDDSSSVSKNEGQQPVQRSIFDPVKKETSLSDNVLESEVIDESQELAA